MKSIIDKNNKKEYALIIGARGYIGNNLHYFLKKKKITVIKSSRKIIKNYINIVPHNLKTFQNIDIKIKNKINYIFQLGANDSTRKKIPNLYRNLVELRNILNFSREIKSLKKIVLISSSNLYRSAGFKKKLKETDKLSINSSYEQEKFLNEIVGIYFGKIYKLPIVIVRFSNLYGFPLKKNTVIYDTIKKIKNNKKVFLSKSKVIRDFLHIKDACEALFKIIRSPRLNTQIFNVGSGIGTDINDLIMFIVKSFDYKNFFIKNFKSINKQSLILDINKIRKMLNWKPSIYLKDQISKIVNYEKKNV